MPLPLRVTLLRRPPGAPATRSWHRGLAAGLVLAALGCRADPAPLPVEELLPQITRRVVQVIVGLGGNAHFGSAVLLDDRVAVTNCHVVGDARTAFVNVLGGTRPAEVTARDVFGDLCLLALPPRSAADEAAVRSDDGTPDASRTPLVCRPSADLRVGEHSHAVGFATGRLGFSHGELEARYPLDGGFVLRTSAGFLPGASGGGLFDDAGRLIGVLTVLRPGRESVYLAVPCEWLAALTARAAAAAAGASTPPPAPHPDVPFWHLADLDRAEAPRFMQALRFEAAGRWPELEALTDGWRREAPDDANVAAWHALALRHLQDVPPPIPRTPPP